MKSLIVDFNALQIDANDEVLSACVEDKQTSNESVYATKYFQIHYDSLTEEITEIISRFDVVASGILTNYDDNCTIMDSHTGDVLTIAELFTTVFDF